MLSAAIWDEVLFAAPVLFATAKFGPWLTLAVVVPAYWVIGSGLSLLVVAPAARGQPGWLARVVQTLTERTESSRFRRHLLTGSVLGFFLASWILGGILTSYILAITGLRLQLRRWVIAANAIWAVTFTAQYAGVGALIW